MEWIEKLALTKKYSHIAEFFIVFKEDITEKFLRIFSGVAIRVPTTAEVFDIKRDIHIFHSLKDLKDPDRKARKIILSRRYKCSAVRVEQIFLEMEKLDRLWKEAKQGDFFKVVK